MLVPNLDIRGSWCWVLDIIDELGGGNWAIFFQGSERHCGIIWKEFYYISVDNCPCLRQGYVVESVVVFGSIHIPTLYSSGLPTLADSGLDVYNGLDAWWGNSSGVVVKVAIKLCLDQEGRINSRWLKKIQGEYRLWKESTP